MQSEQPPPTPSVPEDAKVTRIPGVQLDVKVGKEVIIRIPGIEQSYRGKIVGLDPYDFIIAKVRLPSNVRQDISFGGEIVVKFVHHGTIYGFKAVVINTITSPTPLVFFEYPEIIEYCTKLDKRYTLCSILKNFISPPLFTLSPGRDSHHT